MPHSSTQVLVTGGAGFIGSHLVQRLLQEGSSVRVLDNLSTGRRSNLDEVRAAVGETVAARLSLFEGDIQRDEDVARAVDGIEVVFHLAALGSVERSIHDPMTTHEVNATGTLRMLIKAREAGVRRFVFAGSSSVYGEIEELPKREATPTLPLSPYALSKQAGELSCRIFGRLYGMETVTLRYFNVFGERQNAKSQYAAVIPLFISRLLAGEPPRINGDGTNSRDFTYVANVVEANLLAARAPADRIRGEIFNIACGSRHSLNELVGILRRLTGSPVDPQYGDPRPGDVRHSEADITRARQLLGYEPTVSFEEGLGRTIGYFRKTAVD